MWEERNREDARLLEAGDHATLLATYYPLILGRCRARLRFLALLGGARRRRRRDHALGVSAAAHRPVMHAQ